MTTRRSATPTITSTATTSDDSQQAKLPPPSELTTKQSRPIPAVSHKRKVPVRTGRKASESESDSTKKDVAESSESELDEKATTTGESTETQAVGEPKFSVGLKIRASYGTGVGRRWYDARILQLEGQGNPKRSVYRLRPI